MTKEREFDLQDRLVDYAVRVIGLSGALPETKAGKHISSQILRSGTSPAPNYGEAQSAESKADFTDKIKVALRELRETETWLKIILKAKMIRPEWRPCVRRQRDGRAAVLRREGLNSQCPTRNVQ